MALCTTYSSIVVSGAGDPGVDGTYLPESTTLNGYPYTKWVKEGGGYEIVLVTGGPFYFWTLRIPPGGPSSFTRYQDYDVTPSITDVNEMVCPTQGQWFLSEGAAPAPTITGVTGDGPLEPTFGLPTETVALITSRFGSVANFLRLRNQGQV